MMSSEMNSFVKRILSTLGSPIGLKLVTIGVLTLLLLKPATMIESVIEEHEARQKEVVSEISSKWGREQTITGPILSVPYRSGSGEVSYLHCLPDTLDVSGEIYPQVRYRGIFEAVVYNAHIVLTGKFSFPHPQSMKVPHGAVDWSAGTISIGVSDLRGIREAIAAKVNGKKTLMHPGIETKDLVHSGVSTPLTLDRETGTYSFKFVVNVTGSNLIHFIPVGKSTKVSISSPWPNPSFTGAYLPSERSIDRKGFTATWRILDLNRDYPQQWLGKQYRRQIEASLFGVGLYTPIDFYQKSLRTTKYAVLFVALTFLAFFISELVAGKRLHPAQYLLIGLAIMTFYTLLFSLSEHIRFGAGYLISSTAVIALVTAYAKSILRSMTLAGIVGCVLVIVYGYSYWLLQMADYALLVGSVGLFVVLSIVMFVTRRVDWYSVRIKPSSATQPVAQQSE